jgi:mono/diheme cytochrome c family protein
MRLKILSLAAAAALGAPAARADAPSKTPQLVEMGKASFANNCASCHGPTGAGDGAAAKALNPKPRNLATESLKQGAKPAELYGTITGGIKGTAMIAFKHLSEEDRWALAYFVQDLRASARKPKAK